MISNSSLVSELVGIPQKGCTLGLRLNLLHDLETLSCALRQFRHKSCQVTTRPSETGHQSKLGKVPNTISYDGNNRRGMLRGLCTKCSPG